MTEGAEAADTGGRGGGHCHTGTGCDVYVLGVHFNFIHTRFLTNKTRVFFGGGVVFRSTPESCVTARGRITRKVSYAEHDDVEDMEVFTPSAQGSSVL
jgi:hypothetical protein